jgi:shikimate dehydrogenase
MMNTVSAKTRVVGIIGCPVAHSLSPSMHNAAFAALGLDWVYVPFPVAANELSQAVAGLKALGVAGFNVTIPHKVAILPLLDRLSPEAELIGAVNTVSCEGGHLTGFNTDASGLLAALGAKLDFHATGRSILILGAGGAARSAFFALAGAGASRIDLANRSIEKACHLVSLLKSRKTDAACAAVSLKRLAEPGYLGEFDLIINTTSVGMGGDAFTGLEFAKVKPGLALFDMVYAPPVTPLLASARLAGIRAANGIGMLVAQGEKAFAIWTGLTPPAGIMERSLSLGKP